MIFTWPHTHTSYIYTLAPYLARRNSATIRLDQDNEIDVSYDDDHDSKTAGEHQHRLKPTSVTVVAALHTTTKGETKTEDQPVLHREDLESPPDACQIRVAIATKAGQIHLIHPPRAHQPMSAGKLVQKWEQLGNKANTVRAMTWLQHDGDLHAMLYVACGEDIIALRWESEPADGQELRICLEETHKNVGGVVSALVVAHWYGHSNGTQESCLVSAVGKTVVVWERAGRKRASYTINSKGGVTSLAWLPNPQFIEVNSDKGWIAIGDGDGVITLWDYSKHSFPNSANSTGVRAPVELTAYQRIQSLTTYTLKRVAQIVLVHACSQGHRTVSQLVLTLQLKAGSVFVQPPQFHMPVPTAGNKVVTACSDRNDPKHSICVSCVRVEQALHVVANFREHIQRSFHFFFPFTVVVQLCLHMLRVHLLFQLCQRFFSVDRVLTSDLVVDVLLDHTKPARRDNVRIILQEPAQQTKQLIMSTHSSTICFFRTPSRSSIF